jgi:hypothetical protein
MTRTYNPYAQKKFNKQNETFSNVLSGRWSSNKPADNAGVTGLVKGLTTNPKPVKFEYLIKHRGIKVIVTDHAREQMLNRYGMCIEFQKTYFQQCIDSLADKGWTPAHENHEVFLYSQKHRQGIIAAFRKDFKSDTKDVCLVCVTCYPKGRRKGLHSDTETIFV